MLFGRKDVMEDKSLCIRHLFLQAHRAWSHRSAGILGSAPCSPTMTNYHLHTLQHTEKESFREAKHRNGQPAFGAQAVYIKNQSGTAYRRLGCEKIAVFTTCTVSRGIKSGTQAEWLCTDSGQLNSNQELFWQRAASGLSSQGGYFGSETAQWLVSQSEQAGNQARCKQSKVTAWLSRHKWKNILWGWTVYNNHVVKH